MCAYMEKRHAWIAWVREPAPEAIGTPRGHTLPEMQTLPPAFHSRARSLRSQWPGQPHAGAMEGNTPPRWMGCPQPQPTATTQPFGRAAPANDGRIDRSPRKDNTPQCVALKERALSNLRD
jgi:hypothetical protein